MDSSPVSEFQSNQQGVMTARQRQFLFWRFMSDFLGWGFFGTLFAVVMFQQNWFWSVVIVAIMVGLLLRTLYVYGPELLQSPAPKVAVGEIYTAKNRQSWQVAIDGVALNAKKSLWEELQHGATYEIFYSERSKWILSYRRMDSDISDS